MPLTRNAHRNGILLAAVLLFLLSPWSASFADETSDADRLATQQIIESQIGAFQSGDHEKAYSFAGPGIQRTFPTVERFIGMVTKGYGALYDPESYVFGRSIENAGQIHQEVLVTDRAGKTWQAVYTLQRQADGSWKITGVKLNPHKGTSV